MSDILPRRLRDKEKVEVTCTVCGTVFTVSRATFHRNGENNHQWKCRRCVMTTMSDEDKEKRSANIKKGLANKSSEEKQAMTKKRLKTISNPEFKAKVKQKQQQTWKNKTAEELSKISKRASENTSRIWENMPNEEHDRRLNAWTKGFRNWFDNLSDEERQRRSEERCKRLMDFWDHQDEEYRHQHGEKTKKWWNSLTEDEKNDFIQQHRAISTVFWANLPNEERERISQRIKSYWSNLPEDVKLSRGNAFGETIRNWYSSLTEEEKAKLSELRSRIQKEYWISLSEEEKAEHSERTKAGLSNMSDEQKETMKRHHSRALIKYWESAPDELKSLRSAQLSEGRDKWNASLTDEEKAHRSEMISQMQKEYWDNLPIEQKRLYKQQLEERWNNLSEEEKAERIRKSLIATGPNNLNLHFEKRFNESAMPNSFYFIPEVVMSNDTFIHAWDYGIYDTDNNLVMVVDLDGAYYHGDKYDYDGLHSKEEYDEKRVLSIPTDVDVKYCIISELTFEESFKRMIKILLIDYNSFIENIFNEMRNQPFPYPHYSITELMNSYDQLRKMKCDDKYHRDISLNTRIGDRLIQHFHRSIWHANVKRRISPYDAWYDDKLLRKCIENRTLYQNHLNPNKILQGFNVSKIAPKVSIFSAGRAKMIISKYLSEYNTVFDPFSGFSGRMLGSISLGKKYIGQDINEITARESNQLMDFLREYGVQFDASVTQQDILISSGEYPCLFTCPPYSDKEQWNGTPVDKRSCDDWIDICLSRFKCKRYVFVVDKTTKYAQYAVDEIQNKSHLTNNKEYIILIDRA